MAGVVESRRDSRSHGDTSNKPWRLIGIEEGREKEESSGTPRFASEWLAKGLLLAERGSMWEQVV